MEHPLSNAQRYRERAEKCRQLAGTASSAEVQNQYEKMAEQYIALAEVEETLSLPAALSSETIANRSK